MSDNIQPGKHIKVSLPLVLIVPFVVQIVLVAGLVGFVSYQNGQRSVNRVAHQLRSEITENIRQHLGNFLAIPHQVILSNANAIHQNLPPADDAAALERYFFNQIQAYPTLSSVYFANTEGGLVDAGREGASQDLYVILTEGFARGDFLKYGVDVDGNHTQLLATVPDFDARTRSWFINAVGSGTATWSDIYILFTGQDLAVSASRPVYENGELLGVVSSDIFLSQMNEFLQGLTIGETGFAFIMERSGLLIASSTGTPMFTNPEGGSTPERIPALESQNTAISEVAAFIFESYGDYGSISSEQQLEFKLQQQKQFIQIAPVHDDNGIDWLVVVVIPESDFMSQIRANNRITTGLISVAVVFAVLIGIFTARYVTEPVMRLNMSTSAIAEGNLEVSTGPQWILEIDTLAASFNHMVERLKTTLQDLKSEISERKQAEHALRQRLRYEEGISACSKALLADGSDSLVDALGLLLDALQVSRVYINKNVYSQGELCMEQFAEVCAPGIKPLEGVGLAGCRAYSTLPDEIAADLAAGKPIARRLDSLSDPLSKLVQDSGVRSLLILPIKVGVSWYGFLGFEDTEQYRDWQVEDIRLLGTTAEIIGTYLERQLVEYTLRKKSGEQELLLDSMEAQVWYLTDFKTYGLVNRAHADFFGLKKEDMEYKRLPEFVSEEIAEMYLSINQQVFEQKQTSHTEEWIPNADGEERLIVITQTPSMTEDGDVEYVVCVGTDVTERIEMEQQLRQQDRLAAVGQLAAGIAHDFNNIITSIVLYTQLSQQSEGLSETLKYRLNVIEEQANRAADLVQQILDFGRKTVLKRQILDLKVFLKEIVQLLERTLPEHIEVSLEGDPAIGRIFADPTRVQQVIVNLALNARDAMPDGGRLRIQLEEVYDSPIECDDCGALENSSWVITRIIDDGEGIPSDIFPKILEPFFTTKAPEGHGLGLAQVYGIVKQHGGYLDIVTDQEKGTAVTIYWPLHRESAPVSKAAAQETMRGHGETILVVEDNDPIRAAMVDVLHMLGYEVLEASNGIQALTICESSGEHIDLVISDLLMPQMGGVELARKIEERAFKIKVLLLTGHPLEKEKNNQIPANVVDCLMKPPGLDSLAKAVSDALHPHL